MLVKIEMTEKAAVNAIMAQADNTLNRAEVVAIVRREEEKAKYYSRAELDVKNVLEYWHVYGSLKEVWARFKCTYKMRNIEKMMKKIRRYYKGVDSITSSNNRIIIGGDTK